MNTCDPRRGFDVEVLVLDLLADHWQRKIIREMEVSRSCGRVVVE